MTFVNKSVATARRIVGAVLFGALILGTSAPAGAADRDVQTTLGGLTLNARLMLADGKQIADGVALITHGTFAHNRMELIDALQTALQEQGISSLAINLSLGKDNRESAMVDCAAVQRHGHTDALDEIGAWVAWLKREGADKIYLVGHSRGGNQTAWYATERPDPAIRQVLLLAPATWNADDAAGGYARQHGKQLDAVLKSANDLIAAGKGDTVLNGVGLMYCDGADVTAKSFAAYYAPDPRRDTPTLLRQIKIKTLVVAGSEDDVVKNLPALVKPLVGEMVQLVSIDGAGHFFLDFFTTDAADAMAKFISADGG